MSTKQHQANIRRFIEACLNQHNLANVDEFVAPTAIGHSPTGTMQGIAEYRQFLAGYFTAFPDLHFTLNEVLVEGDTSVVHWAASGTHQGHLAGIPPTGKPATNSGVTIDHWTNGKVQEEWIFFDNLSVMQQLGVIPTPG